MMGCNACGIHSQQNSITNSTIISAENIYEIGELMMLIKSMFATNNHSPEMVSKPNINGARKFLVGENVRRTECSIVFKNRKRSVFPSKMLLWKLLSRS